MIYPGILAFCVSLSVLLLQLAQTRIFSVIFWNNLVYFIISIALLGFGISGTWLSIASKFKILRKFSIYKASLGYIFFSFLSSFVITQMHINNETLFKVKILIVYVVAILPYFCAGWILGSLFLENSKNINILYFADLVGAALGCLIYLALITPLGAPSLIVLSGFIVFIPVAIKRFQTRHMSLAIDVLVVLCLVICLIKKDVLEQTVRPDKEKAIHSEFAQSNPGKKVNHEFSQWNAISRIDVASAEDAPNRKIIFIDGDAWTGIPYMPPVEPKRYDVTRDVMTLERIPYVLKPEVDSALVIGAGGGLDVLKALRGGAKEVDAVEINPTTFKIGTTYFTNINNNIFSRPGVHLWNEEGRSFVKRNNKKYDVIMMHAIDTFAAMSTGAYVLSENYLYTKEAVQDYLDHLKPNGILCITRWNQQGEGMRLFTTALESLYDRKVPNPNASILAQSFSTWIAVAIKNGEYTSEEIQRLKSKSDANQAGVIFPNMIDPETIKNNPEMAQFETFAQFREKNLENLFYLKFPYDVRPVTDDNPFFFNYEKWSLSKDKYDTDWFRGDWPTITLFGLLLISIISILGFIFFPLVVYQRKPEIGHFYKWSVYFVCLGVSYIFVEIAIMQRFSLLLGHPSRSIAVVLGTLLFASGIGSFFAKKIRNHPDLIMLILAIFIITSAKLYPAIIHHSLDLSLPMRYLVTMMLIFPLGICMGIPFPMAILAISDQQQQNFVPWAWAINGGSTVLGSILAIIFAIASSFTTVLFVAALGYVIALLCYRGIHKKLVSPDTVN